MIIAIYRNSVEQLFKLLPVKSYSALSRLFTLSLHSLTWILGRDLTISLAIDALAALVDLKVGQANLEASAASIDWTCPSARRP